MKVQWEKLVWIALAIVLTVVGCGTSATQATPTPAPTPVPPTLPPAPTATTAQSFPTGIFAKANLTFEFKPDGTSVLESHSGSMDANFSGTYTVTGDQFVIKDDSTTCQDAVGTYTWTYDGNALRFKVVGDKCRDRLNLLDQSKWVKNP